MRKREIKFVQNNTNVPVIKFRLKSGTEGFAIVDSGSESTAFDYDFAKANKKDFKVEFTNSTIDLVGVASKAANPLYEVYTEIVFFDGKTEAKPIQIEKAMLMNLGNLKEHIGYDVHAIIGSDVFTASKAKIDYNTHCLVVL